MHMSNGMRDVGERTVVGARRGMRFGCRWRLTLYLQSQTFLNLQSGEHGAGLTLARK